MGYAYTHSANLKTVNVAILGFGTVGAGIYRILTENHDSIAHREILDMQVKRVLVRDFENEPNINLARREVFTTNIADIVNDPEITIVCECMGGTEPARTFILQMLEAGKTVATSNKEVVAKHWPEFEQAAKKTGAGFYIEATAGGGIPIIRTLIDGMQANNIDKIMGIVNGTTNYILTKMDEENASFEEVLKEAQQLGYAEANPASDVEGWDCVYKLSILGSIAFHARVELESIYREGITQVSKEDFAIAKELGYTIKLLAIGKKTGGTGGKLEVRVHPTMIPHTHPLASIRGVFNGVFMHGDAIDDVMLYGRGAGQMPTASAVVSDVIYAAKASKHAYMTFNNTYGAPQTLSLQKDWQSGFSLRLHVNDKPGVLSRVSKVLADHGVSIRSMMQRGEECEGHASILIVTHQAQELAMQKAVQELKTLDCVDQIQGLMRVEH